MFYNCSCPAQQVKAFVIQRIQYSIRNSTCRLKFSNRCFTLVSAFKRGLLKPRIVGIHQGFAVVQIAFFRSSKLLIGVTWRYLVKLIYTLKLSNLCGIFDHSDMPRSISLGLNCTFAWGQLNRSVLDISTGLHTRLYVTFRVQILQNITEILL